MKSSLDIAGLDEKTAFSELCAHFDSTPVGEMFTLTGTATLHPLLLNFQEIHWGAFDWFPLENGPKRWRAAIHRMREQPGERAIQEFMTYDHRRCDHLYLQLEEKALAGDVAATTDAYRVFELGMLHHFQMEEEIFFPTFEEKTGMRGGPTMVMCMEHEQLRGLLKQMHQSLEEGDLKSLPRIGNTLLMVIQQHNAKEEQMLYTMADLRLGQDADGLLRTMQRL